MDVKVVHRQVDVEMFKSFDKNGDGTLSLAEIESSGEVVPLASQRTWVYVKYLPLNTPGSKGDACFPTNMGLGEVLASQHTWV